MLEKPGRPAQRPQVRDRKDADNEIDLVALIVTLWRGKWIIACCAAITMMLGGYYVFVAATPRYQSTAVLALDVQSDQIVDIQSVVSGASGDQAAINTELEVLKSRGLLRRLVERLNLTEDPEFNADLRPQPAFSPLGFIAGLLGAGGETETAEERAERIVNETIDALGSVISVTNQRQTYVFTIAARTEDRRKSQLIANSLAELYIQDQIDVKLVATEDAVAWLTERVVDLEAELVTRENQIKSLRADMGVINAEGLEVLNQQLRDRRARLADAEAAVVVQEALLSTVARLRDGAPAADVAAQLQDPTLTRLAADVDSGVPNAGSLFDARVTLLVDRLATNLDRQRQQVVTLRTALEDLSEEVSNQSQQLITLERLERDTEATATLYETFLTRLKETSVQLGIQQADSRVLSAAIPGQQVAPRKALVLAFSLVAGSLIGIAIVLGRQFLSTGYRTAQELESDTGQTILGQIPLMPIKSRQELIAYLNDKPTSAAVEAVRNLRTSLLLSNIDNPPQVILSASSVPGEGKTTTSIALAHNLSGLGKRVLLLEADIRRRTLGEYFDVGIAKGGLISAMSGQYALEDCLLRDPRMKADILMGEKSSVNAADLFSSERFQDFLNELRARYDFIIIDPPPVLVVPDSRVIGQLADAVVFSVAWDRTTRTQVQEALHQFSTVNVRVTGLVLSQISPKGMKRYGYGDRHGAFASYGSDYYDA